MAETQNRYIYILYNLFKVMAGLQTSVFCPLWRWKFPFITVYYNSKNILGRSFKFSMWVDMDNASKRIVLWLQPSTRRPTAAF